MSDQGSMTPDKESQTPPMKKRKRGHRRADSNLQEDRNDLGINRMSARNRSGRGSNRNNSNNEHGEEVQVWDSVKTSINDIVAGVRTESDGLKKLVDMDKQLGAMNPDDVPVGMLKEMEQGCRSGVKITEENINKAKEAIERLELLKAVVAGPSGAPGPSKRGQVKDSAAAAALYDFDPASESSVPSPIGSASTRKYGERASTRDRDRDKDRDSMPPKADSVEPLGASTPLASGPGANNRSKVTFSKGETVAFRPKPNTGEPQSDWILGEVAQVLGEGKSRRYKVLDIEPDDHSKQKECRTSASSMIPITPESLAGSLPDWEPKTTVLALYPNTTTFYTAEVHSMDDEGRVNLKFEGESDSSTLQQVERRFVIEFRP